MPSDPSQLTIGPGATQSAGAQAAAKFGSLPGYSLPYASAPTSSPYGELYFSGGMAPTAPQMPPTIVPHPTSAITGKPLPSFGRKAITDGNGNTYTAPTVTPTTTQYGPGTPGYQADSFISGMGQAKTPAQLAASNTVNVGAGSLAPYSAVQLPNGSYATTDANGTPVNNGYSINTDGTVHSSALGSNFTGADVMGAVNNYSSAVQNLAAASGYSPAYIAAYQQQQQAQLANANIGNQVNNPQAAIGLSTEDLNSIISRAGAGNTLDQANANIALQAQALQRQGNIAGATALVDAYKPTTVSPGSSLVSPVTGQESYSGLGGYQAIQNISSVKDLGNTYPDAGILPTDDIVTARQKAAMSPSFASKNLVQVQLPGGGISFINRNQIVTNPTTGQYSVISPTQATAANSASSVIKTLTDQTAQIGSQLNIIDNNFPILSGIVKQYGLNSSIPLVNQLQQNIGGTLGQTAITQLNAVATGLKATIAQIVSRGGQVDDKTRNEANALLPTNVSYQVLQDLYNVVKQEGAGVLKGMNDEIAQQNQTLNSIYSQGQSLNGNSGSTGTSGNPFAASNFF